ncbi:hypothetical protein GBAR_LOCUS31774 [Geodia barretti]|uniref:Uncharacterized protein n=1 Tax=Geodia barretti TaxID=519541 RepID=A0AA35U2Y2_GEOBA|nr:hypothetical protein GBAR_LOCUS31774 [Geodia barretti]
MANTSCTRWVTDCGEFRFMKMRHYTLTVVEGEALYELSCGVPDSDHSTNVQWTQGTRPHPIWSPPPLHYSTVRPPGRVYLHLQWQHVQCLPQCPRWRGS